MAAPGNDPVEIARMIQLFLERGIAAAPVGGAPAAGQRVVRGHVEQGLAECNGGAQLVGGDLDERVPADQRIAQEGDRGDSGRIAGDDMHCRNSDRAHSDVPAIILRLFIPAVDMFTADGRDHGFQPFARKHAASGGEAPVRILAKRPWHVGKGLVEIERPFHMRIGARIEPVPEFEKEIDDLVRRQGIEFLQHVAVRQDQLV